VLLGLKRIHPKDGNDRELRSSSEETRRLPKSYLVTNSKKASSDMKWHKCRPIQKCTLFWHVLENVCTHCVLRGQPMSTKPHRNVCTWRVDEIWQKEIVVWSTHLLIKIAEIKRFMQGVWLEIGGKKFQNLLPGNMIQNTIKFSKRYTNLDQTFGMWRNIP
jgi:hypothetical protein